MGNQNLLSQLLRASEGTLSLSLLHLQYLTPTPVSRRTNVKQVAGRKIIAEFLSLHDEKYVVPTPLSGIRERKGELRKKTANNSIIMNKLCCCLTPFAIVATK
jgi:hypothetical protein